MALSSALAPSERSKRSARRFSADRRTMVFSRGPAQMGRLHPPPQVDQIDGTIRPPLLPIDMVLDAKSATAARSVTARPMAFPQAPPVVTVHAVTEFIGEYPLRHPLKVWRDP